MMKALLPWMVLSLAVFFCAPLRALEMNEELANVRILAVHPQNLVVLNRGLEDGVRTGDHIKLRSGDGYAARALCLKSGLLTSHWRLYRIVESERISRDLSYTIIGLASSEPAPQIENWPKQDTRELPEFDEKKLLPAATVRPDLPKSLKKHKGFDAKPITAQNLMERNYDPERLRRDLSDYRGEIFAAPWTLQRGGGTQSESLRFGARLASVGTKYGLAGRYERASMRARNADQPRVINDQTEAGATFIVRGAAENWDAESDLTLRQARFGELATPRRHLLVAPIGLTHHFADGKSIKKSFFSYAPTYDLRAQDDRRGDTQSDSGLRHAFRLGFTVHFSDELSVLSDTRWRPAQELSTWRIDTGDALVQQRLMASWRLGAGFHLDYEYLWLDDAQLRRVSDLPRVVTTNSLNLRYAFEL